MAEDADDEPVKFTRPCILKIIKMYKELPCLWNRSSYGYKDKDAKDEAWKKLTELVQKCHPGATRVHLLRKVESLRACHRKERCKVERAKANGKKKYMPKLWYYSHLTFLNGGDARRALPAGHSDNADRNANNKMEFLDVNENSDVREDEEEVYNSEDYSYNFEVPSQTVETPAVASFSGNSQPPVVYNDQYDAIGVNVAAKLRSMPQNMRIICEKLINDALFSAQMNSLTPDAKILNSDPFN